VEPLLDERAKSASGFLGVGAAYFDFEPSTALGTQHYQIEYALSIGRTAVAANPNLGLELLYELYQSAGRPEVEPRPVGNLQAQLVENRHDQPSSSFAMN